MQKDSATNTMKETSFSIGFGTAAIGRPQYINIRAERARPFSLDAFRKNGLDLLEVAYQKGVRYFDTAPGYGIAEEMLIDWINQKKDPGIEIATKWGYTYTANFDPLAKQHEVKEHSLAKLNEQWEHSRKLLPWLRTYQIHSATLETQVLENKEVLARLADLKQQHSLYIGLTTTGVNQIEVLQRALKVQVHEEPLFDAFQVTYNVFDQSLANISEELFIQNKRIIVKEALANGRVFPNADYPHYSPAYTLLQELARKYQVGIDAIALRFCLQTVRPFTVLSGANNSIHLLSNLQGNEFLLDEKDIKRLKDKAIPPKVYWAERKRLAWN